MANLYCILTYTNPDTTTDTQAYGAKQAGVDLAGKVDKEGVNWHRVPNEKEEMTTCTC